MKVGVLAFRSQVPVRLSSSVRSLLPASKRWRVASLAALVAIVVGVASVLTVGWLTSLPGGLALRVADTDVTEQQVSYRMDVLKALYGVQPPGDEKKKDAFRRDSAKAVAMSIVLDNETRSRNIIISDKSARDTLTEIINKQLGGDRQSFIDLLRQYGASEQDVIDEIKRQQSVDRLFQQVGSGAASQVTDDDVRKYYVDHKATMVTPERRSIQNIVVTDEDQAKKVFEEARSGSDFSALVKQYSVDESTKSSDGKLGLVEKSQLEDTYANQAFSVPVDAVFGPVKTSHGWNVGRVLEVNLATPLEFEQIKDQMSQQLRWEKATETWRKWLGDAIKNAHVKYADNYRPSDPDAPPPVPSMPPQASSAQPAEPGKGP
ncbi:peptidyl-prolyl cis-trans isomerase [Candidatus Protofrankia californiensis]|uniref:peptidyl-prolyl cis-trans isomerase n=1 Tax=Candidatus Protofrankia californiensis TaxID=1839754 RepID=UPI0010416DD4|nr:peptidyl-prolyl cis-trans isomerase [Candidatus Protofrankia californiensis]